MNKRHLINVLIILIIGIIVYANSFGNEFVWDDDYLVVNNTFIKDWRCLNKIFSSNLFGGSWGDSSFYRPIQSLTLLVDYSFWHLNPFGYHLTNTLLHIANAILIYLLAMYLFRVRGAAIFTALLFLVHPVQTEAVTYISGRADPLMTLFLLLSSIFFIKALYIGSLSCFILALLSKEVSLIFPILLLIYCLLEGKKIFKKRVLSLAGYFLISIIYLLVRVFILNFLQTATSDTPLFTRIIISCKTFAHYLGFIVFPFGLHMERQLDIKGSLLEPDIWLSLVLLILFIFFASKTAKRSKITSFGLWWFLTSLLPTSGIFPINAFLAEHWLYVPSVGLFLAISSYAVEISNRRYQKISPVIFILILTAFSMLTIRQNTVWKDKEKLYKHILKLNPQSSRAHFNLGSTYGEKNLDDEAILEFKKAIELKSDYVDAYVNLGYAYQKKGKVDEAVRIFKKAIEVKADSYLPYYYLANLYNDTSRATESIELYQKALKLKPTNPDIYFDLGRAYDKTNNNDGAIKAYQRCIELSPSYVNAYLNLGSIYAERGRFAQAEEMWTRGLRFEPHNSDIKRNLEMFKKLQ